MPDLSAKLVPLTSSPSEFEAAAIAAALREQSIPAQVSGGTITGFRAEVPGEAQVLVFESDLERARNALRAIKADSIDIDWDEVDVGEGDDAAAKSAMPTPDLPLFSPKRSRWFWAGGLVLLLMLTQVAFDLIQAVFNW
ncbi:MAG: putative signal transducing protein [Phycisphaerales bacterium]